MNAIPTTTRVVPLARAADPIPFEVLWAEHAPRAVRLAGLLCGRQDLAEDLVSDAFVKVLPKYRDGTVVDFWPYLRVALVNQLRSRHRRDVVEDRWVRTRRVESPAPDPEGRFAEKVELAAALAQLSETQRKVLVLRYFEDLSEAETAEIVGCGVGTVKSSASRGLARLRELMGTTNDA